jgi:hypothetical protein
VILLLPSLNKLEKLGLVTLATCGLSMFRLTKHVCAIKYGKATYFGAKHFIDNACSEAKSSQSVVGGSI